MNFSRLFLNGLFFATEFAQIFFFSQYFYYFIIKEKRDF
jgi:hypothetical protein